MHVPENEGKSSPQQTSAPLREYQRAGVAFLTASDGALLADEMGLGKTVQAATAIRITLRQFGDRALVVAPASLLLNWERELQRWAPELVVRTVSGNAKNRQAMYLLPVQVLITSYEHLRLDHVLLPSDLRFTLVLLDEAQRIKNSGSSTALACKLLQRDRSWALSGTPLENSPADLVSIFAFVKPGLIGLGMPKDILTERLRPHVLRRRKADVLSELPPIIVQDVHLELGQRQRQAYDDAWWEGEESLRDLQQPVSETHLLAVLTRLKQLCNRDESSGESIKLEALTATIESLGEKDDKLIVFSQFASTVRWLARELSSSIPTDILDGATSSRDRDLALRRFEEASGPRMIVISLRAGGVGLNLNSASAVILFDRWWNPALESQAIQRGHRFGRTRPLHVIRYLVRDTIEERIASILEAKQHLFDSYIEGIQQNEVSRLNYQDLVRILGLTVNIV